MSPSFEQQKAGHREGHTSVSRHGLGFPCPEDKRGGLGAWQGTHWGLSAEALQPGGE